MVQLQAASPTAPLNDDPTEDTTCCAPAASLVLRDLCVNREHASSRGTTSKRQPKPAQAEQQAAARKILAKSVQATAGSSVRVHSKSEASLLVKDADTHSWLQKRQRKDQDPKPRTYMTRHRRQTLRSAFESIDRDGSGSIDRSELEFALKHFGLDSDYASEVFAAGDTKNSGP